MWSVDTSQLNRLAADMSHASVRAQLGTAKVVRKTAYDCEAAAKVNIVRMKAVDTGATLNSIGVDMETPTRGVVGPTTSYAPYVNNGTYKMAPRPFMDEAVDAVEPGFYAALEKLAGEPFQ